MWQVFMGTYSISGRNILLQNAKDARQLTQAFYQIYDGYRSHLTHRVLNLVEENNILAHSLPSQTSDKTHPLAVEIYYSMKNALNRLTIAASHREYFRPFDIFYFVTMLTAAYYGAVTHLNILAGFKNTILWPPNSDKMLTTALPKRKDALSTVVTRA